MTIEISKSSPDLNLNNFATSVEEFLATCCQIERGSSCHMGDLVLSFALFILSKQSLRRTLSAHLDEPKFCKLGPQEKVLMYNINKWLRFAQLCLKYHLNRDGVYLLPRFAGATVVLGLHILKRPPDCIDFVNGNLIRLNDSGVAGDYVYKPFRIFSLE